MENSKFVHSAKWSALLQSSNNQSLTNQPMESQEPLITLESPTLTTNNTTNMTQQPQWLDHVCCLNIRSIANKINSFPSFVYSRFPDSIVVTETWLSDKINFDSNILSHNYSIIRKDHQSKGAGVMLAIKHSKSYASSTRSEITYY